MSKLDEARRRDDRLDRIEALEAEYVDGDHSVAGELRELYDRRRGAGGHAHLETSSPGRRSRRSYPAGPDNLRVLLRYASQAKNPTTATITRTNQSPVPAIWNTATRKPNPNRAISPIQAHRIAWTIHRTIRNTMPGSTFIRQPYSA
jgi:hypothetical protein